jgi:hypothetical protein
MGDGSQKTIHCLPLRLPIFNQNYQNFLDLRSTPLEERRALADPQEPYMAVIETGSNRNNRNTFSIPLRLYLAMSGWLWGKMRNKPTFDTVRITSKPFAQGAMHKVINWMLDVTTAENYYELPEGTSQSSTTSLLITIPIYLLGTC